MALGRQPATPPVLHACWVGSLRPDPSLIKQQVSRGADKSLPGPDILTPVPTESSANVRKCVAGQLQLSPPGIANEAATRRCKAVEAPPGVAGRCVALCVARVAPNALQMRSA
jgi:hypothetical protein